MWQPVTLDVIEPLCVDEWHAVALEDAVWLAVDDTLADTLAVIEVLRESVTVLQVETVAVVE